MARASTSRKSGFVQRGGVMRRESLWVGISHQNTILAAAATAVLTNSANAALLALRPFTIVRTHLNWLVTSDQSAATENFIGSFGAAVVSDQAVAVGVAAVPTPATDQGSDLWFLYATWTGRFELVGTSITSDVSPQNIDSKAMRKVEDGQDVVFVAEAGLIGNGCVVHSSGRMLVKTH